MPSPPSTEVARRLFLALWPREAERRELATLATQVAGRRRVQDDNLHLTLVFLGATPSALQAAYETALTDLAVPAVTLTLDRYGYWPRPRILWLGANHTPPELHELVADLHRRLRGCGFNPEPRAFQAHITLARHFPGPAPPQPPSEPIHWRIDGVTLVESPRDRGATRYRPLRRWPG